MAAGESRGSNAFKSAKANKIDRLEDMDMIKQVRRRSETKITGLIPAKQLALPFMLVRPKNHSLNREESVKQSSFAFRRIQSRELYQPSQSESNGRVRFRIRVEILGRAS